MLAGQEPLRQTLRQSTHAALLGRISVRFHLAPLSKEQTVSYIDFVMLATQRDFVDAVHFLTDLLPARRCTPPPVPAD